MNRTKSYVTYTGRSHVTDYTFPFLYLEREHLKVTIDGEKTEDFTFLSNGVIRLGDGAPNGSTIIIRRETPTDTPLVSLQTKSTLKSENLNKQILQTLYASQEAIDTAELVREGFILIEPIEYARDIAVEKASIAQSAAITAVEAAEALSSTVQMVGNRGDLFGLTLSNNELDINNDIDITPGHCRDESGFYSLKLSSKFTKRLNGAWREGTDAGGLDTGEKKPNSWYHVFIIIGGDIPDANDLLNNNPPPPSSDKFDVLFSLEPVSPNLPIGYYAKRRIGTIGTDADGKIRKFTQTGDYFGFHEPFSIANGPNSQNVLRDVNVPEGVKLNLKLGCYFTSPSGPVQFGVKDPDEGPATNSDFVGHSPAGGMNGAANVYVYCNKSAQIYTYGNRTDTDINTISLRGWHDQRGVYYFNS